MEKAVIIAIDPGIGGGVAARFDSVAVQAYACPDTFKGIYDLLKSISESLPVFQKKAYIEKVNCMPGQGVKSVWTFSANYAAWQMALVALGIPFEEVSPQKWMKLFGALPKDKAERKRAIKDRMEKRYPEIKVTLKTADALGILSVYEDQ